jgi:transcriptional regulator with XRE-family HTH domain
MLKEVRTRQGVSQAALADAIGFRQTDVSKVERGVRRLDVLELRAWMSALGTPVAEFVSELDARLSSTEVLGRQRPPQAKPR